MTFRVIQHLDVGLPHKLKSQQPRQIKFRALLSLISSLARRYLNPKLAAEYYTRLFQKPDELCREAQAAVALKPLGAERLEPHIHRQAASLEQALVELAVNGAESIAGKMIGRFGQGRFQSLKFIVGDVLAKIKLVSKVEGDVARSIEFCGLPGKLNDAGVELAEVEDWPFAKGTEVKLSRALSLAEQAALRQVVSQKLKYIQGVEIFLNGQRVNDFADSHCLRSVSSQTLGRVEITVDATGFVVRDNGKGMDARALITRYLPIGNSEGEHEPDSNKAVANLFYSKNPAPAAKGRVSFLLCGLELQGVGVEGVGLEERLAIELGTGLKRTIASDKVVLGEPEVEILKELVEELLGLDGDQKWAVLNSLMQALDKVNFVNGQKGKLQHWLRQKVGKLVQTEQDIAFVPNRKGFTKLRTDKPRIYLDERLFKFDPDQAGLTEHDHYKATNKYRLFLAEFEDDRVFEEVATDKVIILNRKYADNVLLVNKLFGFHIGYGKKEEPKVRILLPWELAKAESTEQIVSNQTTGLASIFVRIKKIKDLVAELLILAGRPADQAQREAEVLGERTSQANREWGVDLQLGEVVGEKKVFSIRPDKVEVVHGRIFVVARAEDVPGTLNLFEIVAGVPQLISRNCELRVFFIETKDNIYIKTWRRGIGVIEEITDGALVEVSRYSEDGGHVNLFKRSGRVFVSCLKGVSFIIEEIVGQETKLIAESNIGFGIIYDVFVFRDRIYALSREGNKYYLFAIKNGQGVSIEAYNEEVFIFPVGDRVFVSGWIGDKGEIGELINAQVEKIDGGYNDLPTVYLTEKGVFICGPKGEKNVITQWQGKATIIPNELCGYSRTEICQAQGKVFISGHVDDQSVLGEIVDGRLKEPLLAESDTVAPRLFEMGQKLFVLRERNLHSRHLEDICLFEELGGETIAQYDYFPKITRVSTTGWLIVGKRQGQVVLEIFDGETLKQVSLPEICDGQEITFEAVSGDKIMLLVKTFPDEVLDKTIVGEIIQDETGQFCLAPIWAGSSKAKNLTSYSAVLPGQQLETVLPNELPAPEGGLEYYPLYAERKKQMLGRIVRGDYCPDVSLVIAGYLGEQALSALGEELTRLLAAKAEEMDFFEREVFLGFVEKLWQESKGEIERGLFCQVVDRWISLREIYLEDRGIMERLFDFFTKVNLYQWLYNGQEVTQGGEIEDWVCYFREENLDKLANWRVFPEFAPLEGEPHELSFYLWASREYPDWEKESQDKFETLLAEFDRLSAPELRAARHRLRGVVVGQELEPLACLRELVQNSRDAGSQSFAVESYLARDRGEIYQIIECQDQGQGMSRENISALLLNIESDNKVKERLGGKLVVGGNGIGFKSIFGEADRVVIRTSQGDGKIIELDISCVRRKGEFLYAMVNGSRTIQGEACGTKVALFRKMGKEPIKAVLEALMLKRRLKRFVGLIEDMPVFHNLEKINEEPVRREALTLATGGSYRLLEMSDQESRVVQRGLKIADNKADYLQYLPNVLREGFETCVFEIGEDEVLIWGRGAVMSDKEKLSKVMTVLALRKMVRQHLVKISTIPGLPPDYLYSSIVDIPDFVIEDAAAINGGDILAVDFSKYEQTDYNNWLSLMTLIELEDDLGQRISLAAIRQAIRIAGQKPTTLESSLLADGYKQEIGQATLERRAMDQAMQIRDRIVQEPSPNEKTYLGLAAEICSLLGFPQTKLKFYSHPTEPLVAKGGFGGINFRQEALASQLAMVPEVQSPAFTQAYYNWWSDFMELVVHEFVHANKQIPGNYAHSNDKRIDGLFVKQMQTCFEELIKAGYVPLSM